MIQLATSQASTLAAIATLDSLDAIDAAIDRTVIAERAPISHAWCHVCWRAGKWSAGHVSGLSGALSVVCRCGNHGPVRATEIEAKVAWVAQEVSAYTGDLPDSAPEKQRTHAAIANSAERRRVAAKVYRDTHKAVIRARRYGYGMRSECCNAKVRVIAAGVAGVKFRCRACGCEIKGAK